MAVLTVAAALVGAGAAGAATKTKVHPETRFAFIFAKGSNGWRLQITAQLAPGRRALGFYARGPHHQEVSYVGVKGKATGDGTIEGTAPGVGRVAVKFERTSATQIRNIPQPGCQNDGKSAILRGYFRGTIEFHGEGGYTTVARSSARGEIDVGGKELCRRKKHRRQPTKREEREVAGLKYFLAGTKESGGDLTFSAFSTPGAPGLEPVTEYSASYAHERDGLTIIAATRVTDDEGTFSLIPKDGTPSEVPLEPPAPFSGTGIFRLESPTTASWMGDISVEIPTLGRVALAGSSFWAGACEGANCTKTFPPDAQVSFRVSEQARPHPGRRFGLGKRR